MIKNYFYKDSLYKKIIKKKKDPRVIKEYKKILRYKKMIKFVYQNKPLGTGDAVLKTKKYIKDKFFLMLLPDDLIVKNNCAKSMIKVHKKYKSSVMASMNVNKKTVSRWGIYKLKKRLDATSNDISPHVFLSLNYPTTTTSSSSSSSSSTATTTTTTAILQLFN